MKKIVASLLPFFFSFSSLYPSSSSSRLHLAILNIYVCYSIVVACCSCFCNTYGNKDPPPPTTLLLLYTHTYIILLYYYLIINNNIKFNIYYYIIYYYYYYYHHFLLARFAARGCCVHLQQLNACILQHTKGRLQFSIHNQSGENGIARSEKKTSVFIGQVR